MVRYNIHQKVAVVASLIPHKGIRLGELHSEVEKYGINMTRQQLAMFIYYYLENKFCKKIRKKNFNVYYRV